MSSPCLNSAPCRTGLDHDRLHAGEKHDPRITRVGKIMRQFRIDELPQMWNVLKGEMSFIGPRASDGGGSKGI